MAGLFRRTTTSTLKARGIALLAALVVVLALPSLGPYAQRHRDLLTFAIGGIVFATVLLIGKRSKVGGGAKEEFTTEATESTEE
jgi:hypothetical protein